MGQNFDRQLFPKFKATWVGDLPYSEDQNTWDKKVPDWRLPFASVTRPWRAVASGDCQSHSTQPVTSTAPQRQAGGSYMAGTQILSNHIE